MIDEGRAQGWRAGLVRDVQHAVRGLVRQPALSLVIVATLALALAAGATSPEAARLANHAAGLVVAKFGPATISAAELMAAV